MSKEIQCKCCKEYWWEMNIHSKSGLCPNCYDYVADIESKLAESEDCKNMLYKCLTEKDIEIETKKEEIAELQKQLEEKEKTIQGLIEAQKYLEESASYQMFLDIQKQLEEKEKDNQFFKKMYLSEKQKNDNYHTEKYALDKPVEELRKIKLTPKEKEIYYKGFDNCERQFATHIAELEQQLQSQPAEIVEKINGEIYTRMVVECKETKYTDINLILNTILKEYQK